jgi:hypothetical protein
VPLYEDSVNTHYWFQLTGNVQERKKKNCFFHFEHHWKKQFLPYFSALKESVSKAFISFSELPLRDVAA